MMLRFRVKVVGDQLVSEGDDALPCLVGVVWEEEQSRWPFDSCVFSPPDLQGPSTASGSSPLGDAGALGQRSL